MVCPERAWLTLHGFYPGGLLALLDRHVLIDPSACSATGGKRAMTSCEAKKRRKACIASAQVVVERHASLQEDPTHRQKAST